MTSPQEAPEDWQTPMSLGSLQTQLDEGSALATRARPGDWGYYLGIGRGLGYFSWFPNRASMLRYLVQVEILHAPTSLPDREHYDALVAELQAIAAAYTEDQDAEAACAAFNRRFPDFRLEWLGSFDALGQEASAFARALISAYGQDPASDPEAFAAYLEDYGL